MIMFGWTGQILHVNLTSLEYRVQEYDLGFAHKWIGGRGFAIKILFEEIPAGADPLGSDNRIVVAAGPLSGFMLPNSGKIVVASKSPLTGGYGDGNIGSHMPRQLRKAGFDAIVISGIAESPQLLVIRDESIEFLPANELWGKTTFELHSILEKKFGRNAGVLSIGPAGENMVHFAVVRSLYGRAGGRPGIGAVFGSKRLKAIVALGSKDLPAAEPDSLASLGKKAFAHIRETESFPLWHRQGTMLVHSWCNEHSVLPTYNFREGMYEHAEALNGDAMEKITKKVYGCPQCNMQCGHTVVDLDGIFAEMDYENVGMLGSNDGIQDFKSVAKLNRLADDYGLDTISLGDAIAFTMELSENKMIPESDRITWGDIEKAVKLTMDIVYRRGIGDKLADGVWRFAKKLGPKAEGFVMHTKGLPITAYDCHVAPGMALAFATSPIGAHHKDCWTLGWESSQEFGFNTYSKRKVEKIIEYQRIRGGMFETLVVCRFPWIELGFELEWYPRFLKAATGEDISLQDLYTVGDRIYSLIRLFWVRERGGVWSRTEDSVPERWFNDPLTKGAFKGAHLDRAAFNEMLSYYYELRGWDQRGLPTKSTLADLGLDSFALDSENIPPLSK
ncbi:MAG: aldehyde ferredoxin oxidoreductase family protein [Candidatus Ranarchaeia archaeon]